MLVVTSVNVNDNVATGNLQQGLLAIGFRVSGFDPYLGWLDIPPHERPPSYYRLLGLRPLESDPQIIASSAQRVIAHVSQFQNTEHAAACTQLLGELTAARDCLLNPGRKQAYDSGMSQPMSPSPGGGPLPTQPQRQTPSSMGTNQEQPMAGPIPNTGGERALPKAPQIPTAPNERQISQSPPVPNTPAPFTPPAGHTPIQPSHPPAVPGNPSYPASPGEQQITSPGVPQSLPPTPAVPQTPSQQPAQNLPSPPQPATQQPASAMPTAPQPQPPTASPPAWAASQRTGQVETVVAGQSSPQEIQSARTNKGRQLRRTQQTQSAYMLFGIAMALVVFFFGAVLLLAIFLNQ